MFLAQSQHQSTSNISAPQIGQIRAQHQNIVLNHQNHKIESRNVSLNSKRIII